MTLAGMTQQTQTFQSDVAQMLFTNYVDKMRQVGGTGLVNDMLIFPQGPYKYYVSSFFLLFLTHPPSTYVLIVSKNGHFLNSSTQSNDYVIFEWSLIIVMSIGWLKNSKILSTWFVNAKLCNQVRSISLFRWRTLTLLKI